MIRRRRLATILAALAAPSLAAAQSGRRPRLAIFSAATADASGTGNRFDRGFFPELRRHGYEEGRTLDVERWSAKGDTTRFPEIARQIANSRPDAILTFGFPLARALQAATTQIPIVVLSENIVGSGLADSLSRPGRNVTGVGGTFGVELPPKRLELLREAVPAATRIAYLVPRAGWDTTGPRQLRDIAPRLGVTLVGALMDDPIQPPAYRRAFAAMLDQRIEALMVASSPENFPHRELVVELATANRLPMIASYREFADLGGLMSYGTDLGEAGRILADYVARVLKGEKPADMPIRLIDRYELVVNLKTARTLGLTIPSAILFRADEVIE